MESKPLDLEAELADIGASLLGLDPKRDGYAEERRRLEARLNLLAMHVATQRRETATDACKRNG